MGQCYGRKALLIHSALVSVLVAGATPGVCATVDNRPADGFADSGYYWPKTILWSAIRHPPGIYWMVYFFYAFAVVYSGFISILLESKVVVNAISQLHPKVHDSLMKGLVFGGVTSQLGSGLLMIGIAANHLSDVVQAYLIGMCMIQVVLDTLRGAVNKSDNFLLMWYTIQGFQLSATFGIAMLDSYGPLNHLNAAYSVFAGVVALGMSVVSTRRDRLHYRLGFAVSSLQMVFCVAAYFVAKQVDGVNSTQATAFLLTALFNFLFITLAHAIRFCCCRHNSKLGEQQHLAQEAQDPCRQQAGPPVYPAPDHRRYGLPNHAQVQMGTRA